MVVINTAIMASTEKAAVYLQNGTILEHAFGSNRH